jgi:type II restriction-modification system restriction subunit
MHINLGSLCFNMKTETPGGTPAWGTELGQGNGYRFNFEGMESFLPSMLYTSIQDIDNLDCRLGKTPEAGNSYEYVVVSKYSKIYVNNIFVENASFLLLIVRLIKGKNHVGRMTLKYSPKMEYNGEKLNEICFGKMRDILGLNEHSAWFISEIFTKNQDELHFVAHIVDKDKAQRYTDNNVRKEIFKQFLSEKDNYSFFTKQDDVSSLQTIFYGTPGSGKSHRVKELTNGKRIHRTTFHPDSDYASFVGCYKPTMVEEEIKYSFTPQVFTEAYIDAWQNPEEEVYLIIEEINRGNCAQIFGDLFQLLDRNTEGKSDYQIKADNDLRDYLYSQLGENHDGIKNGELCLPPNLFIFATMNTSDQSLFPMDSAFKRRWDWEYVPVDYSEDVPSSKFIITLGERKYRWVDFLEKVNKRILEVTDSEDKQMGNFFIKADVSEVEFKSKVMFYLWNEVCRDEYHTQNNFFHYKQENEEKEFSFNDLYQEDGLIKLHGFMEYLGMESQSVIEETEHEETQETEEV